jgi:ribosomal protection tetracycline resistance protein
VRSLNLGIVAHVDAGKTSLTERLLFEAGVIDEVGRVDEGSTQTDSLALERRRGITIKSAVVSFVVGDVAVNLIDTPGHPDFIAEVERVLHVLDGAVLVVSAVEGVQAQTRVLMRTLRRLGIPTVVFVNKVDRVGARDRGLLDDIAAGLARATVPLVTVAGLGGRDAVVVACGPADPATGRLVDVLADVDDGFAAGYVADEGAFPYRRLRAELARHSRAGRVFPVLFGSAVTGAGVEQLMAGLTELLPADGGDAGAALAGSVFKVDRGPAGDTRAYVRVFAGTLHTRDRIRLTTDPDPHNRTGPDRIGKVTGVSVFDRGGPVARPSVSAGQIGLLRGLTGVRVGDDFHHHRDTRTDTDTRADTHTDTGTDTGRVPVRRPRRYVFAPPTLATVVTAVRPADTGALHAALAVLTEQDPLINLRRDELRQEISISLYGEVQKEVIGATLADEYGLAVTFRESTTICVERPTGTGAAAEFIGTAPFRATVGLRVEPADAGAGVLFGLGVELGSMPLGFFAAVEQAVHSTLREGIHGWQVTDCVVTMTHSGFTPPPSTAGDFRHLTPLVLMDALRRAGTRVYEPIHHFGLEIPPDTLGPTLAALAQLRAVAHTTHVQDTVCRLDGDIPAAHVHRLQAHLPTLTRGEGVLETAFDRYEPVRGHVPARPRTDHNPLNRKEYLLHVQRLV